MPQLVNGAPRRGRRSETFRKLAFTIDYSTPLVSRDRTTRSSWFREVPIFCIHLFFEILEQMIQWPIDGKPPYRRPVYFSTGDLTGKPAEEFANRYAPRRKLRTLTSFALVVSPPPFLSLGLS